MDFVPCCTSWDQKSVSAVYFQNSTTRVVTCLRHMSLPPPPNLKQCPLPQDNFKTWVYLIDVELHSSVFVWGMKAIWIKGKNPCSIPESWIWVTFDYIVLKVSISLNSLMRGGEGGQVTARLASSETNNHCPFHKAPFLFFSSFPWRSESEINDGRRLRAKGREARVTKPIQTSTNSHISAQWGEGSSWII